eukprot:11588667-Alexandrium_andersonii.AAC.1
MASNKFTMQQRAFPELPDNARSTFGCFRAPSGNFGLFRELPDRARKCPTLPGNVRKHPKLL